MDWEDLKNAGRGTPVVIGGDVDLANVAAQLFHRPQSPEPSVPELIEAAARLRHPEGLLTHRHLEKVAACEFLAEIREERTEPPDPKSRREFIDGCLDDTFEPEVGEWPSTVQASGMPGLTVATEILSGRALDRVHIALVPTADWTTIPIHLRWGGWNACPPPEFHTAAFRSWHARYGAELVGLNLDTLNLRVRRRPESRDDSLSLAHEMFDYCEDIVLQGTGSLALLAAILMVEDWWFFWWD